MVDKGAFADPTWSRFGPGVQRDASERSRNEQGRQGVSDGRQCFLFCFIRCLFLLQKTVETGRQAGPSQPNAPVSNPEP